MLLSMMLVAAAPVAAAGEGGEWVVSRVMTDLATPTGLNFLPGGELLVASKQGDIEARPADAHADAPTVPVLRLRDHPQGLRIKKEVGLLGLAVDPRFEDAEHRHIYVYWPTGDMVFRVSRFTLGPDLRADMASEVVLYTDTDPAASCCHHGGALGVGPDGFLYLGTGDKFEGAAVSQNDMRSGGKLHRMSTDGSPPPGDNYGMQDGVGGIPDTIFATGLRNPFKGAWHGDQFLMADVGGNDQGTAWEDVHVARAGANYGWPYCEGPSDDPEGNFPLCDPDVHDDPIFSYSHHGKSHSITGGFVYRAGSAPAPVGMAGKYVYADYIMRDTLYAAELGAANAANGGKGEQLRLAAGGRRLGNTVALVQGPDGRLFAASRNELFAVDYVPAGSVRVAALTADTTTGVAPLSVAVTAELVRSTGAEEFVWYNNGVEVGQSSDPAWSFVGLGAGRHLITVLVVSDTGARVPANLDDVMVLPAGSVMPVAKVLSPPPAYIFVAGETIPFECDKGDSAEMQCIWTLNFQHNGHAHPVFSGVTADTFSFHVEPTGHSYSDEVHYELTLTLRAPWGGEDTTTTFMYPDKTVVAISAALPVESVVFVDGIPQVMPYALDTLKGFQHSFRAADVCVDGQRWAPSSWNLNGQLLTDLPELHLTTPLSGGAVSIAYASTGEDCVFTSTETVLYRINAGGEELTDAEGHVWVGDDTYLETPGVPKVAAYHVAGLHPIFETERFVKKSNTMSFRFAVATGQAHTVKLHLAEQWDATPGRRSMDILIDGQLEVSGLDPVVFAGGMNKAALLEISVPGRKGASLVVSIVGSHTCVYGIEVWRGTGSAASAPTTTTVTATTVTTTVAVTTPLVAKPPAPVTVGVSQDLAVLQCDAHRFCGADSFCGVAQRCIKCHVGCTPDNVLSNKACPKKCHKYTTTASTTTSTTTPTTSATTTTTITTTATITTTTTATITTTTTTARAPVCKQIACVGECAATVGCGWNSGSARCVDGGKTSASELASGACNPELIEAADPAVAFAAPSAAECRAHTCGRDCAAVPGCGWSSGKQRCAVGGKTSNAELLMGECSGTGGAEPAAPVQVETVQMHSTGLQFADSMPLFTFKQNVDQTSHSAMLQTCAEACGAEPSCQGIVIFTRALKYKCVGVADTSAIIKSNAVSESFSVAPAAAPVPEIAGYTSTYGSTDGVRFAQTFVSSARTFVWKESAATPVEDIAAECASRCSADPRCAGFSLQLLPDFYKCIGLNNVDKTVSSGTVGMGFTRVAM